MILLGALILLILSIIVLIGTSHLVIDSAMKISHMTKIGQFTIGFIFIALATSLPELAVSFSAVSLGDVGLSIGNLLGSNVTDIALILGILAIMSPLVVKRETIHRLSIILFVTSLIPLSLLFIRGSTQIVGAVLIVFFFVFIYYSNKKKFKIHRKVKKILKLKELFPFIVLFLVGIFGLLISSNYVVESALEISKILGIAGSVVGATIIAVGTSLPELAIGIECVRLGHWRLAMGEVIGSTLTNISLVLGFVLLTAPFVINMDIFTTMIMFVLLTNIVLFYLLVIRTKGKLERKEGLILLFIYILFLMSLFATQIIII
jgi:cation:H+ antiporter